MTRYVLTTLVLALLAAAPAWAGAEDPPPDMAWPEVGLVLPDQEEAVIHAYFASRPERLGDRLSIALLDADGRGHVVSAGHCCLMKRSVSHLSFQELPGYPYDLWRLQLTWPGPPPREALSGPGFVLPGREPMTLSDGGIGIDLEQDGQVERFMLCHHRPSTNVVMLGEWWRRLWHAFVPTSTEVLEQIRFNRGHIQRRRRS
jgi:hypothetical protein